MLPDVRLGDLGIRVFPDGIEAVRRRLGVPELERMNPGQEPWQKMIRRLDGRDRRRAHAIRRRIVNHLLRELGRLCEPYCTFLNVGSDRPESDVDVTVQNAKASIFLDLSRRMYATLFGPGAPTMGALLDVNMYASEYYDVCSDGRVVPMQHCTHRDRPLPMGVRVEQMAWAMLRIERSSPEAIDGAPIARGMVLALRALSARSGPLGAAIKRSERALGLLMREKDDAARSNYMRSVSIVRSLEPDAYLSYGAFAHIVLHVQQDHCNNDGAMTLDELVASFLDNYGFLSIATKERGTNELKKQHQAKYVWRCCDAIRRIGKQQQHSGGHGGHGGHGGRETLLRMWGQHERRRGTLLAVWQLSGAFLAEKKRGAPQDAIDGALDRLFERFERPIDALPFAAILAYVERLARSNLRKDNMTEGCTRYAMDDAARDGHLDVVIWLHFNRTEGCTENAMDKAARYGHLDVVKWLHENRTEGCTRYAMDDAAANGHLDVVIWLHLNRTEGCTKNAMDFAAGYGRREMVA
ncbi:hypothetical protein CEUSTIGMA_g11944.t1 [Chlamydomonas eustigma]|uniref:Uncharacterized protein n=1 Tax=Chlamydomonas eustigma TaxID=1157962 RepID=A0A250XNF5_9CHLO|nr:hypothetical protein CEUSTIGMA_g11944.t1 [Chlamydomonas eustigma]|eukprot:GAX84523.1 hypothetical protein CEUSTIGMA_g11944.t1 [Chlamydomonas eustigma]